MLWQEGGRRVPKRKKRRGVGGRRLVPNHKITFIACFLFFSFLFSKGKKWPRRGFLGVGRASFSPPPFSFPLPFSFSFCYAGGGGLKQR